MPTTKAEIENIEQFQYTKTNNSFTINSLPKQNHYHNEVKNKKKYEHTLKIRQKFWTSNNYNWETFEMPIIESHFEKLGSLKCDNLSEKAYSGLLSIILLFRSSEVA